MVVDVVLEFGELLAQKINGLDDGLSDLRWNVGRIGFFQAVNYSYLGENKPSLYDGNKMYPYFFQHQL
ncbi:hypothetical protein EDE11_116100 [Methylomonas methanica]|uniref:Uncharacterized protein n=2 Tax=Methylomonas TaxID=416 RepID=A0A126T4L4_9GAMM|nr:MULTISPECIES: hypothetical protein [Methylomonas]AMK77029.1 hypothetical protein JT25_011100 [Methylomonas denitrificans]OAI04418.1 hypothetical protein A1342_21770 [Methylomonas methanica]TCV81212.1 hypothetical protein EDE11_116100 [Methylomonas methanica]